MRASESQATSPVEVTFFNVGRCRVPDWAVRPGGGLGRVDLPALVALLEHPTVGPVLYDTGYSTRFFEATEHFPHRVYRWITPVRCAPADNLAAQLRARGVDPAAVRWVIVSHFDPDHIGGLRDFPNARFVCHADAWAAVSGPDGDPSAQRRLLPGHLPVDFEARIRPLNRFATPTAGPLPGGHDLFRDGSVLLLPLPGHAPGQLAALVARPGGGAWLLVADAVWTRATLERAAPTVHLLFAADRVAQRATYTQLRQLRHERPDVTIVPTHCPEAADELVDVGPHPWRER